jgi:hypothetical protein
MDPITLEPLFSICDRIEIDRVGNNISKESIARIVSSFSSARNIDRRVRDISRVLLSANLLENNNSSFSIPPNFHEFIKAWNSADIAAMNNCLKNYLPYERFLNFVRSEKVVNVPAPSDKKAKMDLGNRLKEFYQITFVAFDTFRFWAAALGQTYKSPFDNLLFWGGEWNTETPSLEIFHKTLIENYETSEQSSGYVNIGRLADKVCRELQISFQAFEIKLNETLNKYPMEFTFAMVTRRQLHYDTAIPIIHPRLDVISNRIRDEMSQRRIKRKIRWISNWYLEDGLRIEDKVMRLIRRV